MRLAAAMVAMAVMAAPFVAPAQRRTVALENAADTLRTGQYAWRDDDPAGGEVRIVIDRGRQLLMAYREGTLIGVASVSTGKPGKTTPLGDFEILQKRVWHRSNLYSNAPMPYMQRLTWSGIALHAGENPGYPASHGCIRLPRAFAVLLFNATRLGASVAIVENGRIVPTPARRMPLIVVDNGAFAGPDYNGVTWTSALSAWSDDAATLIPDDGWVPDAPLSIPEA